MIIKWLTDIDPVKDIECAKKNIYKSTNVMSKEDEISFKEFSDKLIESLAKEFDIPLKMLKMK